MNGHLKLCDFGLSRGIDDSNPTFSTAYVVSRYYRAPELLLFYPQASKPVDIWSCGCILFELLTKKVLFQGDNTFLMLEKITTVLGTPSWSTIKGCQDGIKWLKKLPFQIASLRNLLPPNCSQELQDLIGRMLTWDPDVRITADEALKHPYFKQYYQHEPLSSETFDFDLEFKDTTPQLLKSKWVMYDGFLLLTNFFVLPTLF